MHFDPRLQRQIWSLGFEASIIGRDICATLFSPILCNNTFVTRFQPQSSNKSQCTGGDRSQSNDDDGGDDANDDIGDDDDQQDDDNRDEDDVVGGGDHPDEGGGSKLCEIGWNEQREGQLIFLNSI